MLSERDKALFDRMGHAPPTDELEALIWSRMLDAARSEAKPSADREPVSVAEEFVRKIARLTHSGDAGYIHPDDPDDDHFALDRLIAEAREVNLRPLRDVLGEALSRQTTTPTTKEGEG